MIAGPRPWDPMLARWALASVALLALACGASEVEGGHRSPETPPESENQAPEPEPEPEPTSEPEPEPEPTSEPEPEPVDIEAGTRLGPIRIGMSEDEVRALGFDEVVVDPRSTRFGPYRVFLSDGQVRRVEAEIGALERVRFGETVIEAGTHIHEIRDTFGDCVWTEGGGERYRCAGGTLTVRTTHTMSPHRYTLGVERR